MTDISLSVGLETKNARDEALALAKTLDQIEEIGKRLAKMSSPFKNGIKDIKETTSATKDYVDSVEKVLNKHDKYGKQLKELNAEKKILIKAQQKDTANTARYNRALAELEDRLKKVRAETNTGTKAAKALAAARKAEAEATEKIKQAEGKEYLNSAALKLKQHKELMAVRAKSDAMEKKAIAEKESAYKKLLAERLKQHNTVMRVREASDRKELKAIRDRLKEHQKEMAIKAKVSADTMAFRAAGKTSSIISMGVDGKVSGSIDKHTSALERNSRAAYRAASANKANNAILSDQAGFWRFALRGALLYFSSLATTQLVDTNIQMMALEQSLIAISDTSEQAASKMSFLREVGNQLGYTVLELGSGYKNLTAAARGTALEGSAIDAIFRTVAESSRTLGLSVADTEGSLRAISQMISKGTVQSEELKGQLGERLKLLTLCIVIYISKFA